MTSQHNDDADDNDDDNATEKEVGETEKLNCGKVATTTNGSFQLVQRVVWVEGIIDEGKNCWHCTALVTTSHGHCGTTNERDIH